MRESERVLIFWVVKNCLSEGPIEIAGAGGGGAVAPFFLRALVVSQEFSSFWDAISEVDMMSDLSSLSAAVSWAKAGMVLAVEDSGRLTVFSPFLFGIF